MRIAVIPMYDQIPAQKKSLLLDTSAAIVEVLQAQGHIADLVDFHDKPGARLGGYQALFFGFAVQGMFSKVPEVLRNRFLLDAGSIVGKRAWVFTIKRLLANLTLELSALAFLEREGLIIRNSFVLAGPEAARTLAPRVELS